MEMLIFLIMLLGVDLIALRWGATTSDIIDSPEWERQLRWDSFP